jgi:hypothetical protein
VHAAFLNQRRAASHYNFTGVLQWFYPACFFFPPFPFAFILAVWNCAWNKTVPSPADGWNPTDGWPENRFGLIDL